MKRILITSALLLLAITASSQARLDSPKNLRQMAGQSNINLVIFWKSALIVDVPFNEWVKGEPDWAESETEIRLRFMKSFNGEARRFGAPFRVGTHPDADFTLVIRVVDVTNDGSKVTSEVSFIDKDRTPIYSDLWVFDDGMFGSVANLMGDAFALGGKKMIRFLNRHVPY